MAVVPLFGKESEEDGTRSCEKRERNARGKSCGTNSSRPVASAQGPTVSEWRAPRKPAAVHLLSAARFLRRNIYTYVLSYTFDNRLVIGGRNAVVFLVG